MVATIKVEEKEEVERNWFQILAIFSGCSLMLVSGSMLAWPSPFLIKITEDPAYDISESEASYFTVLHPLGMCISSPFWIPLANLIGRKRTTLIAVFPLLAALLIKAFVTNVWLLYFSRILAGSADAMAFSSLPAYIGEISVPKVRGTWGNVFICNLFVGQFIVNLIGSYFSVRDTSFILLVFPALFLLSFTFMPESPYYFVLKNRNDEAKRSLRILRRKDDVEKEFEIIKAAVEKQMQESGTWKDLVSIRANRKALIALVFLRISQTLSGVYAFAAYIQFIFAKAGGNFSPQTSAILYTALTSIMYTLSATFSDKLGRRKAYTLSVFLSGIVVLAEAIYFLIDLKFAQVDLSSIQWFPLAGMLVFVLVSSFGVGIIPTLMLSELFAASVKSQGVCAATVVFSFASLVVNNGFYYFNAYTGLYGPFFLFGGCNLVSALLVSRMVPETKGKTLEEIQEVLKNL